MILSPFWHVRNANWAYRPPSRRFEPILQQALLWAPSWHNLKLCERRRLRFMEYIAGRTNKKRLLDIGCGDGSFLLGAREAGWKVTGTELNARQGRSFGLDVRHTLDHIGPTQRFDFITMWHSLEHIRDIKSTLFSIAGLLAPQGRLIIAVPNSRSLQAKLFGPRWLHLDVPRHLYHFDPGSLRFSLENAGFRICHSLHHEIEYNLSGWSQSAMNYLNPKPNVFLDVVTGKGKGHSYGPKQLISYSVLF